jgi:hypothetical protein
MTIGIIGLFLPQIIGTLFLDSSRYEIASPPFPFRRGNVPPLPAAALQPLAIGMVCGITESFSVI